MAQARARERTGWDAALEEFEHQAEHWDTADHSETGYLIAQALLAAVDIARAGGLQCEHRPNRLHHSRRHPLETGYAAHLSADTTCSVNR